MRARRPSQTASMVAMLRVLADAGHVPVPGFSDPVAAKLLGRGWTAFGRFLGRSIDRMAPARRARALARLELVPLRVLAIDREIEEAVGAGIRQLVVLGAGLDTRAWRMAGLAEVRVFEVDHPATQAWKRRRVAALPVRAARVAFVPVDFESQDLAAALAAAGHQATAPTIWVWEGVVMYLTDKAMHGTLGALADRSAPGSVLVVQYNEPGESARRDALFRKRLLGLFGEPQIGLRTRLQMAEALTAHHLEIETDTGSGDWPRPPSLPAPAGDEGVRARIAVARRR